MIFKNICIGPPTENGKNIGGFDYKHNSLGMKNNNNICYQRKLTFFPKKQSRRN
jgi:hypothetical protein